MADEGRASAFVVPEMFQADDGLGVISVFVVIWTQVTTAVLGILYAFPLKLTGLGC
jgi:hypothetical protein